MNQTEINKIAKQCTELWISHLRQHLIKPDSFSSNQFLTRLQHLGQGVFKYEQPELLDKAMNIIPLQKLYEEAEIALEGGGDSLEDIVIQRLLHWFKNDFFTWVDNAPCDYCGNTKTVGIGGVNPSHEDLLYGAHVVEAYKCSACQLITRFPRYNDPGKLLETRRGRCGEWANCFTLCCRAVGAEARIVYDTTDHVWTEVYSETEQRWIHCDSCEEAWDKPLIYSEGWNKKLSYCTAFSIYEVIDVTKRYTRNWPEVLSRRNNVKEIVLALFLEDLTEKRQVDLTEDKKLLLNERKCKELMELEDDSKKTVVRDEELLGRQSGSLAWRSSRGETGKDGAKENLMEQSNYKFRVISIDNESQYNLVGNASYHYEKQALIENKPVVRLTKAISDQRGGSYCKQFIELDQELKGIEVEFAFRVTDQQGGPSTNGADGFAFVIQAQGESALGGNGHELGYGGIRDSLAIEFDTYKSYDRCEDPSDNHISVHARKAPYSNSAHQKYSLGHTSRIPSLKSGNWMKSKIRILTDGVIEIGLGGNQDREYIEVLKITNQNFLDYISKEKTKAWIGFTASTGGLSENHDIQWISAKEFRNN